MPSFAERMRALMAERGVALRELARRTHYDVGHLSRIANGHRQPAAELAAHVDRALEAGGELAALVPSIPDLSRVPTEPRRGGAETVAYFDEVLAAISGNAGVMRPWDVAELLISAYEVLDRFRRDAREPVRTELHTIAARFALLTWRMHYEAADVVGAAAWLDRGLVAAHAAGDELLVAFILTRRANLAAVRCDPGQVVDLSVSAREHVKMPRPLEAMARRHEAQGHAMAGDADLCRRRLGEAAELLASSNGEGPPYASGFSLAFHEVQAAGCYLELNQPGEAVGILEQRASSLGSGHVRAFNLARLARGYAAVGEDNRADEVGQEAFTLAKQTGTTRAVVELRRVRTDRSRWWD